MVTTHSLEYSFLPYLLEEKTEAQRPQKSHPSHLVIAELGPELRSPGPEGYVFPWAHLHLLE